VAAAEKDKEADKLESQWNMASDPNLKHVQKAAEEIAKAKAKEVEKLAKAKLLMAKAISDEKATLCPIQAPPNKNKTYVGVIFYELGLFEWDGHTLEPGHAFICDIDDLTIVTKQGESSEQPHRSLCR
jgi:hypothetical protein